MLTINNLSYSYNRYHSVLDGISTQIAPGISLMLGENGAGKTTLLGLIAGLLISHQGEIDIDGENPAWRQPSLMSDIFYLTDSWDSPFRDIETTARLHGCFYPAFDHDMLAENLKAFGLTGKEPLKGISLGMRRKSFIAYALALRTKYLLLDEPANGLDIDAKKTMRRLVSRCIGEDQTVVISTHTIADLEMLYDSLIVIHAGRLLLNAHVAEIAARLSFVESPAPLPDALYLETEGALFHSIVPAQEPNQTNINFELLYSALVSGKAPEILQILSNDDK